MNTNNKIEVGDIVYRITETLGVIIGEVQEIHIGEPSGIVTLRLRNGFHIPLEHATKGFPLHIWGIDGSKKA